MLQLTQGRKGMRLQQGKSHVAENVAAVTAGRDWSEFLPPLPQRLRIAAGFQETDLRLLPFQARIVHPAVGPDDRHQQRMTAETPEVTYTQQVRRYAQNTTLRV